VKFLFLAQQQLKVNAEQCVLGFGCGLGWLLVVQVVTSSAARNNFLSKLKREGVYWVCLLFRLSATAAIAATATTVATIAM